MKLFKEAVNFLEQHLTIMRVGNNGIYHLMMPFNHCIEL